jgi:ABC-type lipoprotein export system ATPase subunit
VLALSGVAKSYAVPGGRRDVLAGIDLELPAGRLCAVTGPSGSGKTTLLHLAALLDAPTRGAVTFLGRPAPRGGVELAAARAEIGLVFQRFHLLPHRTARQNVLFRFRYLDAPAGDAAALADAALRGVGLERSADTPARLLSGGEMQRVAIARALARPPRLLLADEPTGNLDAAAAEQVMALLRDCRDRGIAVLVATHNEAWAAVADDHLRLRDGRLKREARLAGGSHSGTGSGASRREGDPPREPCRATAAGGGP